MVKELKRSKRLKPYFGGSLPRVPTDRFGGGVGRRGGTKDDPSSQTGSAVHCPLGRNAGWSGCIELAGT